MSKAIILNFKKNKTTGQLRAFKDEVKYIADAKHSMTPTMVEGEYEVIVKHRTDNFTIVSPIRKMPVDLSPLQSLAKPKQIRKEKQANQYPYQRIN